VCHASTVAGLGTSFGRGGATTCMQDQQNSDCTVIEGSNYAEAHPVGFQWVMEGRARGAKVIHVDPRFSRTSALADLPIRAGSEIAFLGGVIRYVLENGKWFHDYVLRYTNASTIITEEYQDTEDLAGFFSGFEEEDRKYDFETWQYESGPVKAAEGRWSDGPTTTAGPGSCSVRAGRCLWPGPPGLSAGACSPGGLPAGPCGSARGRRCWPLRPAPGSAFSTRAWPRRRIRPPPSSRSEPACRILLRQRNAPDAAFHRPRDGQRQAPQREQKAVSAGEGSYLARQA
jgi:hypothetical protein